MQKGLLIVFEGAARSGKSTLINWLVRNLNEKQIKTTCTEWNSYPEIQSIINKKKTNFSLTPLSYSLMHLCDFSLRYEEVVKPALERGEVVIADRWTYTALTRDSVRGIPLKYIEECYSFARKPDIIFYIGVPTEEALKRHKLTKKYYGYNSGTDIWPELSNEEAYRIYHNEISLSYSEVLKKELNIIQLDGMLSPEELFEQVSNSLLNFEILK